MTKLTCFKIFSHHLVFLYRDIFGCYLKNNEFHTSSKFAMYPSVFPIICLWSNFKFGAFRKLRSSDFSEIISSRFWKEYLSDFFFILQIPILS